MKLNLSIKPHWLINLLTRHQECLHLDEQRLSDSRSGSAQEYPWQEMPCLPQIDRGFIFAALIWQHQGKVYRFSWLPEKKAEQMLVQASQAWCRIHGQQLIAAANACYRLLHPGNEKRYLRQQTWLNIKSHAQSALKSWPDILPATGLTSGQQQAFKRLQYLAKWSEKDLQQYRQDFIRHQQNHFADFFHQVEANPLTQQQQVACITDEHNNLVLAGAGTGKTSVMVGRTGYLLRSRQADAGEILLLAFGNKAAKEMDERLKQRLGRDDIKASTFHALGQTIITKVEGKAPDLTPLARDENAKQQWLEQQLNQRLTGAAPDSDYPDLVLAYLERYRYPRRTTFDFTTLAQHIAYLKDNRIKSLSGDKVHSYGELLIADYLFKTGISYHYRQPYTPPNKHRDTPAPALKTADFRPYKPAFYLPEYDIVIEFRHINPDGKTPDFIDGKNYQEEISAQRQFHKNNNSGLIELDQTLLSSGQLPRALEQQLKKYALASTPVSNQALLDKFSDNGALEKLGQLLSKMLTLYKAGNFNKNSLGKHIKAFFANKPEGLLHGGADQVDLTLQLLAPLYQAYQAMLARQEQIDFDDMITKATAYIQSGQFTSPWSYIMVDEFQDISAPRAKLVKALRDAVSRASLFCVGDDWQAIYRFAGSDVSLTRHFAAYFGQTSITTLDKTFRFNNSICDVASRFISQNPAQLTKKLTTFNRVKTPAVTLIKLSLTGLPGSENNKSQNSTILTPVNDILKDISMTRTKLAREKSCSVLLLARYHHLLPDNSALKQLTQQFPALAIKAMSIHASKGMEADIVLVLGLDQGKQGFPAEKGEPLLIDALLPLEENNRQSPAHAEERRLFYVALTRAKDHVYLLTDRQKPSAFVRELITAQYPINREDPDKHVLSTTTAEDVEQDSTPSPRTNCPVCKTGVLTARAGRYGNFYSCSHYPYCEHTEKAANNDCQAVL
ncbi:UvrD-helicase domain-containing protein [Thalassomonas haliotis]|uniref:DNA 3'-5' helicase n=1 Tax=Thalassomonas haliotis TaxID=485448 RepID=A0ABY7V9B1_9GAMM|nr:UvrD-helicase domain-containing protein [Thalassomonas haliotis]WDE09840.1 UvrD-helicase domain-containing protein [Thalassomonas haliotis]